MSHLTDQAGAEGFPANKDYEGRSSRPSCEARSA